MAAPRRLGLAPATRTPAGDEPVRHRPVRRHAPGPWPWCERRWPPAEAADHLSQRGRGRLLPDAGLYLETPAGPIECYLEWDRATETQERLAEKLLAYRRAEAELFEEAEQPRCMLFVVHGPRRLGTLRRAYQEFEHERERRGSRGSIYSLDGRWPLIATSASRLRVEGLLAAVWERLDRETARPLALSELPARGDRQPVRLDRVLGRRWRKDHPDFWRRLSPLGAHGPREEEAQLTPQPADPEAEAFIARLQRLREARLEEARQDAAAFRRAGTAGSDIDLRSSGINGSMDDREDDVEEEARRPASPTAQLRNGAANPNPLRNFNEQIWRVGVSAGSGGKSGRSWPRPPRAPGAGARRTCRGSPRHAALGGRMSARDITPSDGAQLLEAFRREAQPGRLMLTSGGQSPIAGRPGSAPRVRRGSDPPCRRGVGQPTRFSVKFPPPPVPSIIPPYVPFVYEVEV